MSLVLKGATGGMGRIASSEASSSARAETERRLQGGQRQISARQVRKVSSLLQKRLNYF